MASRWSSGLYATTKCACFCYLGLELALARGPVAVLSSLSAEMHAAIRTGAHALAWLTAGFCVLRALPVLTEGWRYVSSSLSSSGRELPHAGGQAPQEFAR